MGIDAAAKCITSILQSMGVLPKVDDVGMDEPEKICCQEFKKRGKFSRFTIIDPVDLIL
ncbi:MAG: hypothetical protein FJ044_01740 [Candidatus Cloacimonetes bacterium]|nr:hypothetical protein [Candidatus Cloacimonadota bacterium]